MSLSHYIDRQIISKNRGIYFKKGRWVAHLLALILYWMVMATDNIDGPKDLTLHKALIGTLPMLPFLLFFYTYCLYLVPYCFKQGHYKRFWTVMVLLFLLVPLTTMSIQYAIQWKYPGFIIAFGPTFWDNLSKVFYSFFSGFVGYTAILYLMELLEEISTIRETALHKKEHNVVMLGRIKTQLNPAFMSESLDGIIALEETGQGTAAETVILFSDLLRYRLYRSRHRLVPLHQELEQLQNLFSLQQSFPGHGSFSLEVDGLLPEDARTIPMSLINLAEPLLQAGREHAEGSLVMYLLGEETGIQVAIELGVPASEATDGLLRKIQDNLQQLIHRDLNFTVEREPHNYSVRTCIPITRPSIA